MERYSKLTRAISTTKDSATHIANIFPDHWNVLYVPDKLLADNVPQFVDKCFVTLRKLLTLKRLTDIANHPQNNGQAKGYNKKIVARLPHYVAKHPVIWDIFVQPLPHANNTQVHRSTYVYPFNLKM